MISYTSVEAYLAAQSPAARKMLRQLRALIRKEAPDATESVSYGMPAYKLHGVLLYIGGFKAHCSLFALPQAIVHFREQLQPYTTSKGTIQFPLGSPLPEKLIREIIRFRVRQNLEKAAKKGKKK